LSHLKRAVVLVAAALTLASCAGLNAVGTLQEVATATVPANVVIPASNAFSILKNAATNYGRYCIQQQMQPVICSPEVRRTDVRAVRVGTGAQDRLIDTVENGTPAAASVYNLMVGAIKDLKGSPVNSPRFTGVATP